MRLLFFILLSMSLLLGCSASFKEQKEATIKVVQNQLKTKPKETNKSAEDIKFYIPFGFEIEDSSPNNIILKNGSKTYILFYNQYENQKSDVVYKATLNQHKKLEVNKKWNVKENFGYLLIDNLKDDMNEITVGIGGVKLTSEVKTSSLETEANQMIEIVNSVVVKTNKK